MTTTRGVGVLLGLFVAVSFAPAQVKYPPLPEKVDVRLRYRIRADREERVRQFRTLEANLKRLGFDRKRQAEDDLDILDPTAERFEGSIPSKNVFALLDDPRVKTVLFQPTDFKAPDDPTQPVSLRIRIATGYLSADQQRLHGQVVAQLIRLGFREAIGYDTAGYTLVRGDLPFTNLFRLLKDLRDEPAGWFAVDTPAAELPTPLRGTVPIRAVEVLAGADLNFLPLQPLPPDREKFTPGVRAVLDDTAAAAKPLRVEIVTEQPPDVLAIDLVRARLRSSYSRQVLNPATQQSELYFATLEGVVGNVLTIDFPLATDVVAFATEPGVVYVRLPRAAVETVGPLAVSPAAVSSAAEVLAATRVGALHALGYRGRGTKIVVIGTEFPGLGRWLGVRYLGTDPTAAVAYIDLTAEFSRDLLPAPPAASGGSGTAAARAAHLAAPDASLVLVRVDPAAFHQVFTVGRYARGEVGYSTAIQSRVAELAVRTEELRRQNAAAVAEYRAAFANLNDDDRSRQRRLDAVKALDALLAAETALTGASARLTALQNSLRALAGCSVLVNTLVWEDGFPLDGLSELNRLIDLGFASDAVTSVRTRSATRPRPAPRPLWVQASSPSAGSVWGGSYVDADGNGAMEFASGSVPARPDEWTRELNFLATRAADGTVSPALTAATKIRLTVQWRETHDPTAYGGADAIFPLTIRVFKQLDPEGKTRASDELREVARPVGGPYRLVSTPTYAVYEQIVEFAVPEDGRYCVRVEGRSVFDPRLPALRRATELQPRLFAEFVGAGSEVGRPVFASFAPRTAGVGIPGDAKAAITVGATDAPLGTATTGLTGGGPGVELLTKPDLLADGRVGDDKTGGSGVAAGFAGGALAALVGSGAPTAEIIRATGLRIGGPVAIPEWWLRAVRPLPAR